MKKNIFDLNENEEMRLMRDLINTPFGRQYFMLTIFMVGIAILSVCLFLICLILNFKIYGEINYMMLLISILFIFIILGLSLFAKMKWLELLKDYVNGKK